MRSEVRANGPHEDHDDNLPSAPKYVNDGDNYPIVPITPTGDQDHCHDHNDR